MMSSALLTRWNLRAWQIGLPLFCALIASCNPAPEDTGLQSALGDNAIEGYQRALEPRTFEFPQDHGPHAGYKNEWWYFTGNLTSAEGRHFGYQVTFFRIALAPRAAERTSPWASQHIWMAHLALTDENGQQHYSAQRFAREALELAGVRTTPFRLWLEDWRITSENGHFPWTIKVSTPEFSMDLQLRPAKPPVLQGEDGLSQKSATPGNASYYYSMTRLSSEGVLQVGPEKYEVQGLSWLDREWGTSLLGADQQGWDWFSLQLNEGTDLMFYQLRRTDGSPDPHSGGSWVDGEGQSSRITQDQIQLTPLGWWTSPGGNRYPIRWRMQLLAPQPQAWIVEAILAEQWMDMAIRYWEGAVRVLDAQTGQQIGQGYLEMTGY